MSGFDPVAVPTRIPIGPVPTMVQVAQAQHPNGTMQVVLGLSTATGVQSYFLDLKVAEIVGKELCRLAAMGHLAVAPKGVKL